MISGELVESRMRALFGGGLKETPTEELYKWAQRKVYLDRKMTPDPGYWDWKVTPWAVRAMEAARDPEIREVVVMKSSRTGFTEGCLNVVRWMPENQPGPVLFSINSAKKAKKITNVRLMPTLLDSAAGQMTGDRDDVTNHQITLQNMDIVVEGSGSAGPFSEAWYKVIILDEYEEHDTAHEETTADRARGRMVNVHNGTLYIISKPQLTDGPIHEEFLRGSQESFLVPCPHCGLRQKLEFEGLKFDHCRDLVGWDLDKVEAETFYECRHCYKPIEESQKREMVCGALDFEDYGWVAAEEARRGGVKAEKGVCSQQISDFYAFHQEVSWGKLARNFLAAFAVNPDSKKQKWWWCNHKGEPWEMQRGKVGSDDLKRLVAGVMEENEEGHRIVVGRPYRWSYQEGELVEKLPIVPSLVSAGIDRQGDCFKGVVGVWSADGQFFPIDYWTVISDGEVLSMLKRQYVDEMGQRWEIGGGLIDARYQKRGTIKICMDSGFRLHPAMGSGESSSFSGKDIRATREEVHDGVPVRIVDFYNHSAESDLYFNKIKRRTEPRMWLPENYGDEFGRELCSSRLIEKRVGTKKSFSWEPRENIPNDFGDAVKLNYIFKECLLAGF